MGEKDKSVGPPVPLPLLERAVGIAAEIALLALLPAWAIWLVTCRLGSLPTWSWVIAVACPAAIAAWRARRCPHREPPDRG